LSDIIYFDNSATTSVYPEVLSAMNEVYLNCYGNPSSLHKLGNEADKLLQKSRETVAKTLNVDEGCIYFTSGGTESNNWAIKGVARANRKKGNRIITTRIEHPSVLECFKYLENEGFSPVYLNVDSNGLVNMDEVRNKVDDKTILFSFILVNNETGVIQNAEEIIREVRLKNPKTIIHIDAVQAYGKIPINLSRLDADLMSVSSHKIHGPKGCGALYIKKNTHIIPILHGGGQENKYRSGTENLPAIYGFAKAAEIIHEKMTDNRNRIREIRNAILHGLREEFEENFYVNSPENGYEGILNIAFPRVKAQVLMHHLETKNIIVSVGSACSSRKNIQSHVLTAMNLPKERVEGAIRLSFSGMNTVDEALCFVHAVKEIIPVIRY
jgi:cysteine desulfurase